MVYCNSASLMRSLLMCCLRASLRWMAACLLMVESCSCQSLSISCWTLVSSFSSASASSSSASSQTWISIWLSSALTWFTHSGGGGGGGLALRCCASHLCRFDWYLLQRWICWPAAVEFLGCCQRLGSLQPQ
jgi:hypothetical protein